VVFHDRAAHDRYQPDPRHQKFIADGKDNWEKVRVFDSLGVR
ncbi:MAG: Dabb family protein, partial [Planctomycetes bacterium]|nr:Dabb family protein [Planctomycetota bacterium]